MLTADDLKKLEIIIQKVVDKRAEETETKMDQRFHAVDKRFDEVDKRFTTVDKRFDEVDKRFTTVDKRFDEVDKRFTAVDKRFEGIEIQLANLGNQMEQDRKDWSTFFNEAGIFFDEMRSQLVKRIKKLEDNQRVSKN